MFLQAPICDLKPSPWLKFINSSGAHGFQYDVPESLHHWKFHVAQPVPATWLKTQIATEQFLDLGENSDEHRETIKAIQENFEPSDQFWTYESGSGSWKNKMGRRGIAIVREGLPYDSICTMKN